MPLTEEQEARARQLDAEIQRVIAEHGHMVMGIFQGEAEVTEDFVPFSYSVGRWAQEKVEYFVSCADHRAATLMINLVVESEDEDFDPLAITDDEPLKLEAFNVPLKFRYIDPAKAEMNISRGHNDGRWGTAVQIIWPDRNNNFPGDEGYNSEEPAVFVQNLQEGPA